MNLEPKTVLIVDDEKSFLLSLKDGLAGYSPDIRVVTAENGLKALKVMEGRRVDLVVTDLKMPEMDGFELLARMNGRWPEIPVVVMTAFGTPGIAEKLKSLGCLQYMEKPLGLETVADRILKELAQATEGRINGVTLAGFLQLLSLEKKSCTLKVHCEGRTGLFRVTGGDLVDAHVGNLDGEAAAYEILSWDEPLIEMGPCTNEGKGRIRTPLGQLLMEACRIKDEKAHRERPEGVETLLGDGLADGGEPERSEPPVLPGERRKGSRHGARRNGGEDAADTPLSKLAELPGVEGVFLVGPQGVVPEGAGGPEGQEGAIRKNAAGAAAALGILEKGLGRGPLKMAMLEFEEGHALFAPLGKGLLLAVAAAKDANIGLIRLRAIKLPREKDPTDRDGGG